MSVTGVARVPRVLVVERRHEMLAELRDYFSTLQWHVDGAVELEEAEAMLEYREYDAVVCDFDLGGRHGAEGLELVREIRQNLPTTAVLLFSASATHEMKRQALETGADAIVETTSGFRELAGCIAAVQRERTRDGVR